MHATFPECQMSSASRAVYAIAVYAALCAVSFHLGNKAFRAQSEPRRERLARLLLPFCVRIQHACPSAAVPSAIKKGLFTLAQCSSIVISGTINIDPFFSSLMTALVMMQFGTEPYTAMAAEAVTALCCGKRGNKTRADVQKSWLKLLLIFGVVLHHMSLIILCLFYRCMIDKDSFEVMSILLGLVTLLGVVAGSFESNTVRALTDVAAIALYWFAVTHYFTRSVLAVAWAIVATVGDVIIAVQLVLFSWLVGQRGDKEISPRHSARARTEAEECKEPLSHRRESDHAGEEEEPLSRRHESDHAEMA